MISTVIFFFKYSSFFSLNVSDMSGCNDQRLLSMISGEKPKTENQDPGSHKNEKISKNEIENKNKNKIEIESVEYVLTKEKSNQESGPRSSDVVPFVCLQTVVRDVKAANKIEEKKKNEKIEKNEVNKVIMVLICFSHFLFIFDLLISFFIPGVSECFFPKPSIFLFFINAVGPWT